MSKLIVTVISTLDGYAAGEGGNVFVMPIDLDFDRYNLERMRAADTMLDQRRLEGSKPVALRYAVSPATPS